MVKRIMCGQAGSASHQLWEASLGDIRDDHEQGLMIPQLLEAFWTLLGSVGASSNGQSCQQTGDLRSLIVAFVAFGGQGG